jgi:hypothetical protein
MQNRKGRMGQADQDIQNRTGRGGTGKAERDRQKRNAEKERKIGIGRTRQADRTRRTDSRTG